jgi:cytidine deaminase
MKEKQYQISYQEYKDMAALPVADQQLLMEAKRALELAYAPYSKFQVGAAARLKNGEIIIGYNQENAAYPMCLCAERATIAAAASTYPDQPIVQLAISVKSGSHEVQMPAFPCGACRQVITETESRFDTKMSLILQGETGPIWVFDSGKDILPFSFDGSFI